MSGETPKIFKRGARPSPRHRLLAAEPHVAAPAPAQFAVVPPMLSMWGNADFGCCVTSEEAFARACYSVMSGLPEVFVTEAEVIRWAKKYGYADGATLVEVMDTMAKDGLDANGVDYKTGPYKGVNYGDEATLQSALTAGPVKIAIDADALPSGAGNEMGWFALSKGHFTNTDHCVSLSGYGRADYLYDQLKVSLPSGVSPSTPGRLLYTWKTIGFVTQDWLMGTCVEAWVRNPTSPQIVPAPSPSPTPTPTPTPTPVPQNYVAQYAGGKFPVQFTRGPFGAITGGFVTIPGASLPVVPADAVGRDWSRIVQAILNGARFLCPFVPMLAAAGVPPNVIQALEAACAFVPPAPKGEAPCGCS